MIKDTTQLLGAFTRKHLRDALTVLSVMERAGITKEDIKELINGLPIKEIGKVKHMRRLSREQREREFKSTKWGLRRR